MEKKINNYLIGLKADYAFGKLFTLLICLVKLLSVMLHDLRGITLELK
jgi:hypothetical protein